MKALCWQGKTNVTVERVNDPSILNPRDAILRITRTAICGSDLHLYDGYIPTMEPGDILGHEFMGEVVETGPEVKRVKKGDRVVVPFTISCGQCFFCKNQMWSACDNTNPNAWIMEKMYGYSGAALYGYSHMMGGYAGGQAQYARVPFADVGCLEIPEGLDDEKVLFLSDIFPTGYMAAENCDLKGGEVVAIWGCGPVGQFTVRSAFMLGAERVIAVDRFSERLKMARAAGAEIINYEEVDDLVEELKWMTGGRGPDVCIDAVGLEAHGGGVVAAYDYSKQRLKASFDRPLVLRQVMQACRKGGVISIPGVYGGLLDKIPFGAAFGKGLIFKMGQTHMHRYMEPLLRRVQNGEIDPSFVITHRLGLDEAPGAYKTFRDKQEQCIKVVLDPWKAAAA
ncbi:MAG TPA: zinc-dependent alcohol dehydrogenase [Terriglobales bacterium]|nr:zinc-dependent alcohol dehydrogenase [Terriglobales bacterium]